MATRRRSVRAADGAVEAAALGLAVPPPPHAASTTATMARSPNRRRCIDTTRPPVIRHSSRTVWRGPVSGLLLDGPPARGCVPFASPPVAKVSSNRAIAFGPERYGPESVASRPDRMLRGWQECVRNFRYTASMTSPTVEHQATSVRTADDRERRRAGRCVGADGVQGDQRPIRRVARDTAPRRGGHPRARVSPIRPGPPGGPDHRAHLPRARERVGARDRARRRAGGGQQHMAVVLSELARPADPGPRLDRGRARPPPDRRDRGVLGPERIGAGPSSRRGASRSSWSTRPASRCTTRRRSARRTGTAA